MPIKVAFIGAGRVGFTRKLSRDILTVPELQDTRFALHDISERNLDMLRRFGYYSPESNGRLCEDVPWYRKRPDEVER